MNTHFLFAKPPFTAQVAAQALGQRLSRKLNYTEPDDAVDGCIEITDRIHVQVGADYLVVNAWETPTTLRGWPPRRNIPSTLRDIRQAMQEYPEIGV